jgi:hypothetical protein
MVKKSFLFLGLSLVATQASQYSVNLNETEQSVSFVGQTGSYVASDSQVDERLSSVSHLRQQSVALEQRSISVDGVLDLIAQDNLRVVKSGVGLYIPDMTQQKGRLIATYDVRNCHCVIFRSIDKKKAGFVHLTETNFKSGSGVLSSFLKNLDPRQTEVFLLTSWVSDITSQLSDYLTSKGFAPTKFSSKRAFIQDPYGYSVKYLPYDGVGVSSFKEAKTSIANKTIQVEYRLS